MKTLVLTSKKNYVWQSMQEIIPFLVDTWKATAGDSHAVDIVDVDETFFGGYHRKAVEADNLVLTCFTPRIIKTAAFLRNELSLPLRFFIHLHNQATIACWPMRHWGGPQIFRKDDVFISSCSRDAECLKKVYPEAQTSVVPFSYKNLPGRILSPPPNKEEIPFVFIGRVSEQKNLHNLLLALRILRRNHSDLKWRLQVIGAEDGLGSPNMGLKKNAYKNFLINLSKNLELSDSVEFLGYKPRHEIERRLESERCIFISPSLHSDENFGMAAFLSLIKGHLTVLSDWGGHADFSSHFPKQVELCKVFSSPSGPVIYPMDLAKKLLNACRKYSEKLETTVPSAYQFERIRGSYLKLAISSRREAGVLAASPAADKILSKIPPSPGPGETKIFDSYSDELAHIFFGAYGMRNISAPKKSNVLVPWARQEKGYIEIQDPHKGEITLPGSLAENRIWLSRCGYLYNEVSP